MLRRWILLLLLVGLLGATAFVYFQGQPAAAVPSALAPASPTDPVPSVAAAATTAAPPATLTPTASLTPPATSFQVRFHPDGALYVGDWVSLEVLAPADFTADEHQLRVVFPGVTGPQTHLIGFGPYGLDGRVQATLWWGWETAGLPAGEQIVSFTLLPEERSWTETVSLLPAEALPESERQATWAQAESECCLLYYLRGTLAERDLPTLQALADADAESLSRRLGVDLEQAIPLVFIPRLLGHGGFASEEIVVSYLERNYAGGLPDIVLRHEMAHLLDGKLGGKYRPALLVEGLAVYLSGGHFKPEPLLPRAAALLLPEDGCQPLDLAQIPPLSGGPTAAPEACGLGWWLPLEQLTNDFYHAQHEIGYLQAGALVEYLVDTYGWNAFNAFYRDITPPGTAAPEMPAATTDAEALDAALLRHFGLSLPALEHRLQQKLLAQRLQPYWVADVRLTVQFYDTVRRYQQRLDPSAYFLTAWLPDTRQLRQRGITADVLRHPNAPLNLALESWLMQAAEALRQGDFLQAQELLQRVNATLNATE